MRKIAICLILLTTMGHASGKKLEFSIETKDLIKKIPYGYEVTIEGDKAIVKLWKRDKSNAMVKTLKKSQYRYFEREWRNRQTERELKGYKIPEKFDTDIEVTARIKDGDETSTIKYDRRQPAREYLDKRIQSWLQYLERQVLRTSSLEFKKM